MEYRILETLEELKSLIKTNHHNKWMNIREVCDYTSVSESPFLVCGMMGRFNYDI